MKRYEIINNALIKGGQKIVSPASEDAADIATALASTKAARLCNAQYPFSVDTVFAAHPWDQLKKLTRLEANEHAHIEFGYGYEFTLPIDFIRLIEEEPKGFDYDRAAGRLLANENIFEFSYVALPTVADWTQVPGWDEVPNWNDLPGETIALDNLDISGTLTDVLGYHIISRCIYGITGDHNDTQLFEGLYNKALAKATSVQAQQKKDLFMQIDEGSGDSWIGARV